MRFHTRTTITSTLALATLVGCGAGNSRDKLVPTAPARSVEASAVRFRGTVNAVETSLYQPETNSAVIHLVGTGTETHVGRFAIVSDFVLDLATLRGIQKSTLTADNGDMIRATVAAQGIDNGDGGVTLRTIESATITGGTGRFAGATGQYVLRRVLVQATGVSSGTFEGTINLAR